MRRWSIRACVMASVLAAALAAPSFAAGAAIPSVPRIPGVPPGFKAPKVIAYNATIDVAGYVKVSITENGARECSPGRDLLTEFEAVFELGAPRATRIVLTQFQASSRSVRNAQRRRAGAVHRAKVTVTRETNNCAPTPPDELAPLPQCRSALRGDLRAFLFPTPEGDDDDGLARITRGVSLKLVRLGGGRQSLYCLMNPLNAKVAGDRSDLNAMHIANRPFSIPIANFDNFLALKKRGDTLRRSIGLDGPCEAVVLTGGPKLSQFEGDTCTVKGRIVVNVKRTSK